MTTTTGATARQVPERMRAVEASAYPKIARRAASRVGNAVRCTSPVLRLPRKLSVGASSRQSPLRLIGRTIPCRARIVR